MTIQDFMNEARRSVSAHFRMMGMEDVDVACGEVIKANDCRLHALDIRRDGSMMGRYVYLDDLFDRHGWGEDMESLLAEAAMRCDKALICPEPPSEAATDLTLDSVRERLSVKLLGVKNNMSYMEKRPYIDVGNGLAMVAVINLEPSVSSEWVMSVTDEVLEKMGCDRETLLTAALENTMRMEPPVLVNLRDYVYSYCVEPVAVDNLLREGTETEADVDGALLLTNESHMFGASALFYPGVMERVSDIVGSGYYVIPSSIHELILIPDIIRDFTGGDGVDRMKTMVVQGNETVTEREDRLSDNVFHYDPGAGRLRVA